MDTEKTSQDSVASGPVLPLAMLGEGETALIVAVKGASDLRQLLSTLGFVEGYCKSEGCTTWIKPPDVVARYGFSSLNSTLLYCAAGIICSF